MSRILRRAFCALVVILGPAVAQETFPPEQIKRGADIYQQNCSPCHGPQLSGEESAFDLRTFPRNARERFITSVTKGKNQMPPWGGLLKPDEIEALWAYVVAGEKG
jgi:mono/diheme cytochrome c family protein